MAASASDNLSSADDWPALTAAELARCRRVAEDLETVEGRIAVDQVPDFFCKLGIVIQADTVRDLVREYISASTTELTHHELFDIFNDFRSGARMPLRGGEDRQLAPEVLKLSERRLQLPDSWPRVAWNLLMMFAALIHWIIVLKRDSDSGLWREPIPGYVAADFVFSALYAADMGLIVFTVAFLQGHGTVDDEHEVARLYLRSPRFWLDLCSTVPLDVILSLAGAPVASGVFSHLRMFRVPRVFVMWVISNEQVWTPQFVFVWFQVMPLWYLAYAFVAVLTVFATVFARITISNGRTDVDFMMACYFIVQTFSTVGYGDIPLTEDNEMWFASFLVNFGLMFNAITIGRLVTMIQRTNAYETREDRVRETLAVLEYFNIPQQLQTEILSLQEHVLWNDTASAYHEQVSMLPQSMRDNMLLQTRIDVLTNVSHFSDAPVPVLRALATALVSTAYKPEEYISFAGDPHQGVRFLMFGFVARFDGRGRYVTTLKAGENFGFDGILTLDDERDSHKALSYCDLVILSSTKLLNILSRFPRYNEALQDRLIDASTIDHDTLRTFSASHLRQVIGEGLKRNADVHSLLSSIRAFRRRLETAVVNTQQNRWMPSAPNSQFE